MGKYQDPDVVSTSEIASYWFCPEAWRLGSSLGLEPNNERELSRGEKIHEKITAVEWHSQAAVRLGVALVVVALGLLGVCLLLRLR